MFEFLADDPNAVGFLYFDIDKERDWAIYENGAAPDPMAAGDAIGSDRPISSPRELVRTRPARWWTPPVRPTRGALAT